MLRIFPEFACLSNLKILPDGFRISQIRMWPSKEPLANIFGSSGDGERLEIKPSCPLNTAIVIDGLRGSWRKILFDVDPNAMTDNEDNEAIERSGDAKGMEDIGCDEGVRRSWV
jgi:hypothetical protein